MTLVLVITNAVWLLVAIAVYRIGHRTGYEAGWEGRIL